MDECAICGKTEPEHAALNHQFSPTGQLVPKTPPEKSAGPTMIAMPDYVLRTLLMDLGVITGQQLMEKEAELRDKLSRNSPQSPTSSGDSSYRQRKTPPGSMRGTTSSPPVEESRVSGS